MAAISILSGFSYKGKNYDFDRQGFATIEEMKNFSENYLPPVYIATNEEDGCVYVYNVSNEVDDTLGKWRMIEGGGSSDLMNYYTKQQTNTLLDGKVDKVVGKDLSDNNFSDEDKAKLDDLENYDDTAVRTLIGNNTTAIGTINEKLGNAVLQTLAQTVTAAINELKDAVDDPTLANDVAALKTKVGNATLKTTATDLSAAVNELKDAVDDTTLADRVTATENAIDILNGDDTVTGSVDKKVAKCLSDSKDYTDEQIDLLGSKMAIQCDAMPTYDPLTDKITYVKNGTSTTIDADMIWFYYEEDNKLKQSILINGEWLTVVSAGGVNFNEYVSKETDVVSTYTGDEVITNKIPDIAALQALHAIINGDLDDKVSFDDIIDALTSTATNKVLSANQGKVLKDAIDTKLDKVFTGSTDGNKSLQTDANGEVTLVEYDSALDTTSGNAVKNSVVATAMNTKLDKVFTGSSDGNKSLQTDSNGEVTLVAYDDTLNGTSTNAVQNATIVTALAGKVNTAFGEGNENKILGTDANGDVTLKDPAAMGGDAENIAYENAALVGVTNVKGGLDAIVAELFYVAPSITSFTMTPSTTVYEKGQTITGGVSFSWGVNKTITSQTLTDCTVTPTDRSASYTTDITANKTFTLTVGDGKKTATASKSISFQDKIYWGASTAPGTYDSAFILGLTNKKLMTSVKGNYSFNAGSGEYCYFAMPQSMKFTSAWVNGFNTDLEVVANAVSFTNASGYTSTFSIVRFMQASLGSFTAEVK